MKRKILVLIFLIIGTKILVGQQLRTVEVFTYQQAAAFIPIINGEAKSQEPVMYYKHESTKDEPVQFLIHFDDPNTADIYKFIDFSGLKSKKYEIVLRKKAILLKKYEGINKDKQRPAYEKFELKDASLQNYVKQTIER